MIVIDKNYKADLTLPIMIVISGMALTLGFPTENIHKNRLLVLVEESVSQSPKEHLSCPLCRSWNTRHKNKILGYLEPIIVKLKNVKGKYEEKKKEFEKFYPSFNELNKRSNKQIVHEVKSKANSFGCLDLKQLKRKVSGLRKEIQKIKKNLQSLIYLEKSPNLKKHDRHEGRLKLLKEFRAEIKNLIVELNHNMKGKSKTRSKSSARRMSKTAASANLSHIKSQTKLKIEEWMLLESLKMVLGHWTENLINFSECVLRKSEDLHYSNA